MFIFLLNMPINRFLCYIIEWFVLARYIQLANVVMAKFPPPNNCSHRLSRTPTDILVRFSGQRFAIRKDRIIEKKC